jgi:hypothetical protein
MGRVDRQQAGQALDHDTAHLADGLADQRNAVRTLQAVGCAQGTRAHPLGTGAGLAGTAAAQHEPDAPGSASLSGNGSQLIVARPAFPGVGEPCDLLGLQCVECGPAGLSGELG